MSAVNQKKEEPLIALMKNGRKSWAGTETDLINEADEFFDDTARVDGEPAVSSFLHNRLFLRLNDTDLLYTGIRAHTMDQLSLNVTKSDVHYETSNLQDMN